MTALEKMRDAFESCTVMAGVEPDFECIYIVKAASDALFDEVKAENDKLREELEQWHKLTAGIELPEYPITQFQPKDLERENAELRELCLDLWASCPVHDDDCQVCKHYDGAFCDLYVRMEELVDGFNHEVRSFGCKEMISAWNRRQDNEIQAGAR